MKKVSLKILIFLCIITSIIVAGFTQSKYIEEHKGSSSSQVAGTVLNLSSNTISLKMNPVNNEQTYIFSVSNNDNDKRAEVAMEYTLQINTAKNLPLDFELYTFDENILGTQNLLNSSNITEKIRIDYDTNIEQTYQLKIKWRENETNYKYSQETDYIQIVMNGTQID